MTLENPPDLPEENLSGIPRPLPPRPPQRGDMINPFTRPFARPVFTYLMLGSIIGIFALTLSSGLFSNQGLVLYEYGASYGPNIIEGEIWRLFTAMFLHADITHILFNGFALYILGPDMERLYGNGRYSLVYLLSGLFGSVASFALSGPAEFSVGASGAIFGVIGMQLAFFTFYRKKLGRFGQERFNAMLRLVGINLLIGFIVVRINNTAHIGGRVSGFLLGYVLVPRDFVEQVGWPELQIVDRGGLARTWWIVALAAAGLAAATSGSLLFWRAVTG